MCGIFGVIVKQGASAGLFGNAVKRLFILSETRGKEAAGVAVRTAGALTVLKGPARASDFVRSRQFRALLSGLDPARGHIALIGHSRLVTHGTQDDHGNNQPTVRSGMVSVHNGIVANEAELWAENQDLERRYTVDTEVLLCLIGKHVAHGASLSEAVRRTFASLEGSATIATLFQDSRSVLLVTNIGSLYTCRSVNDEALVFASERYILDQLLSRLDGGASIRAQDILHIAAGQAMLVDGETLAETPFSLSPDAAEQVDAVRGAMLPVMDLEEVPGRIGHAPGSECFVTPETREIMLDAWESFYSEDRVRRCVKCLLPSTMPGVSFDSDGVCNHCRFYEPHVVLGIDELKQRVAKFRGDGTKYDCLVPFSGGRDSCYGLLFIKEVLGMTPLAYTYDWGMITDLGRRNQARVVGKLGVEHIIVSADIDEKRNNIRKNLAAWFKKPMLGMIPLWMAGDKQLLYFARQVMRQNNLGLIIYSYGNKMEEVNHKIGFAGITITDGTPHTVLPFWQKARLAAYYGKNILTNPSYINSSLWDSAFAFWSLFLQRDESVYLFNYIDWDEDTLIKTIEDAFGWEREPDTPATWRIDDGTVAFYNYVYLMVAGFTENDAFRSCQIRQGKLTREQAMAVVRAENKPRLESIEWYAKAIGFDVNRAIRIIHSMPKLYRE